MGNAAGNREVDYYPRDFIQNPVYHTYNCTGNSEVLRVMTYNILAPRLCTNTFFPYTPQDCLSWRTFRKSLVVREIRGYNPDVVCLQEVETGAFKYLLQQLGAYSGKLNIGTNSHGTAILYKKKRFKLISSHPIQINRLAESILEGDDTLVPVTLSTAPHSTNTVASAASEHSSTTSSSSPSEKSKQKQRWWFWREMRAYDNNALALVLETKGLKTRLCVTSAHLHWNPEFPEVKSTQALLLLSALARICKPHGIGGVGGARLGSGGCGAEEVVRPDLPLILCGDFNSMPDLHKDEFNPSAEPGQSTGVYELLSSGILPTTHLHHPNTRRSSAGLSLPPFSHSFQLQSAYVAVTGQEPVTTNHTAKFSGTLDYIWFSPGAGFTPPHDVTCTESEEAQEAMEVGGAMMGAGGESSHSSSTNTALPTPPHSTAENGETPRPPTPPGAGANSGASTTGMNQSGSEEVAAGGSWLEARAVLQTPSIEVLSEETALPSSRFPSDHILLVSDFSVVAAGQ